jgi:hypothetical protein
MNKMIQIRNVPESLHRKLKARAALNGQPLSDYLLLELKRSAERPTLQELEERLKDRSVVRPKTAPADAVRRERELVAEEGRLDDLAVVDFGHETCRQRHSSPVVRDDVTRVLRDEPVGERFDLTVVVGAAPVEALARGVTARSEEKR